MLQAWSEIDWVDQFLHTITGLAIVVVLAFFMPWWIGVVISMVVAVVREMFQHPWTCHAGCRTDLVFWACGTVLGVGIVLVLR